jgi:hypothetical protein
MIPDSACPGAAWKTSGGAREQDFFNCKEDKDV